MKQENTNWCQSVAGVVFREGRVLLVRLAYGVRKGKLIVPGGYVLMDESPEDAVVREIMEETGVLVQPEGILGIRFNRKDWYVVFQARYLSGTARSDGDENTEVVWMDAEAAMRSDEVPDLTRKLIGCACSGASMHRIDYDGSMRNGPYSFYGVGAPNAREDSPKELL